MSSEKRSELSRERLIAGLVVAMLLGLLVGLALAQEFNREEHTTYQAALHITNWTNRTLNVTVYAYGNTWDTIEVALNHTENVTIIVTWVGVKETVTFIHSVGPGVYNTVMYPLEAGQWRTVVLV